MVEEVEEAGSRLNDALGTKYTKPERQLIAKVLDKVFELYGKTPTKEKRTEGVIDALSR